MGSLQCSLFATGEAVAPRSFVGIRRIPLDASSWVDYLPGWLSGAHFLFQRLLGEIPWKSDRRPMYDRIVDVPRLDFFFDDPPGELVALREVLNLHYAALPGGPLMSAGLCLYRNGQDSVAWHGDRIGRGATSDTVVAVVSLGAARRFLLRPLGGGRSLRFELGEGDLLVMGGACQREWEHAVPKTCRSVGPRISVQFRQEGVR